ncbi:sulfatase [Salmonella enterica subsp. enterica]|uniref:Sulfatase n=1 Tax=Salmonella enterica I TaxID=59201 RepID=A0A379WR10_SALET|nr:sulfatase [Salmonella enterica subsp. enterica]
MGTGQNVLLITVDGLNYSRFEKQMPELATFAEQNIDFTRHMSSGNTLITVFSACSMAYRQAIWMACYPPEPLRRSLPR